MRRRTHRRKFAVAAAATLVTAGIVSTTAGVVAAAANAQPACPWLNQNLSTDQRLGLLLPEMTLSQKVDLLGLQNALGYENISTSTTGVPELCIPPLTMSDGPQGMGELPIGSTTQLPAQIAVAATWDRSAAQQYGAVLGSEATTKGIDLTQAPELDVDRVPQFGRTFETLGEDPYLTGQLGVADIAGIHSEGAGVNLKHYSVYNQEAFRDTLSDNSIVSNRALHEIYLAPFQAAVTNGRAESVMCSYAVVNGQFACENDPLLTDVLKNRWAFDGYVRSDLSAVHDTAAAFNAGTDVFKPQTPEEIEQLAADGQVTPGRVDDAVARVLREMFDLGAFNRPIPNNATADASTPGHVATARAVSEESTVLLKNTAETLPLQTGVTHSIAVIGADGGAAALTATPPPSSGRVGAASIVTPFQGITQAAGSSATVSFNDGTNLSTAAATAQSADVAVVFVSAPESEGADLTSLSLPGNQNQLIESVAAANPNTVVVLNTASPVTMPWLDHVRAVLQAWYPGQEDGNAIADVLFGAVDPSGKLPMTYPQSLAQTPTSTPAQYPGVNGQVEYSEGLNVGYRGYDAQNITPLFPFGFGLSYTSFAFSNLRISQAQVANLDSTPAPSSCDCNGQSSGLVNVTATVTNTGTRAGSEVAQLYLGDPPQVGEPPRQLKGFQRVTLNPGQSTDVQFTLTAHDLSYWDDAADGWVVPDGDYQVYVGDSSAAADLPLSGSFAVTQSLGALYASIQPLPAQVDPGTSIPVTARFSNEGDYTLRGAVASLQTPKGWTTTPTTVSAFNALAPGQSVDVTWSLTVPQQAEATTQTLTARLDFHPAQTSSGIRSTAANAPVTVTPSPPVQASAAPVVAQAGQSTPLTVTFTNHLDRKVTVDYRLNLPASGITVSPSQGSVTVPPEGTSITLTATAESVGSFEVPVDVSATDRGKTYQLPPTLLRVLVPYMSLAAASNNVGITSDSNRAPGNFDTGANGDSYSAEALANLGITPGSTVTKRGIDFTWPNVPAGTDDNVALQGQAVSLTGSGNTLGFIGAATSGVHSGTVTIFYTDGTMQQATISFQDYFSRTPVAGTDLVATIPYLNSRTLGQRPIPVSLFAAYVPLDPTRTVEAVQLPNPGGDPRLMHVFSMAIGGPPLPGVIPEGG